MAAERPHWVQADATAPLSPGPLIRIAHGGLQVDIAPQAGGRIASIARHGVEQLVGYGEPHTAMIDWGCYPMLPWAGRIRGGRFKFDGRDFQLPMNLGAHAIHGTGLAMSWQVQSRDARSLELSLALPQDGGWPFGGTACQRMELSDDQLELHLSLEAGTLAMPAVVGWHPWFRKPERLRFSPDAMYPRDEAGIATLPLVSPAPGPWDDCFINTQPISLDYEGYQLHLSSDCRHWVVYDQADGAACVEPQSGPPDAFNIEPCVLAPGDVLHRWFRMEWKDG